jgi:hypothetical protein
MICKTIVYAKVWLDRNKLTTKVGKITCNPIVCMEKDGRMVLAMLLNASLTGN